MAPCKVIVLDIILLFLAIVGRAKTIPRAKQKRRHESMNETDIMLEDR